MKAYSMVSVDADKVQVGDFVELHHFDGVTRIFKTGTYLIRATTRNFVTQEIALGFSQTNDDDNWDWVVYPYDMSVRRRIATAANPEQAERKTYRLVPMDKENALALAAFAGDLSMDFPRFVELALMIGARQMMAQLLPEKFGPRVNVGTYVPEMELGDKVAQRDPAYERPV